MTYQETKCHLESIPNAKRLSDAYVCLRVQDVKKLFLFTTTLTFLTFERCCCVVEAQLLGRAGGEVHKIKFFLAQIIDSIDLSLLDYYTPTRFKDAANPIPRVLP